MTKVHHIQAQLEPADPGRGFPGVITEGYYTILDGVLTMTNCEGVPVMVAGRTFTHKLSPGDNARQIAGRLTRSIFTLVTGEERRTRRKLVFPDMGIA